MPYRDHVGEYSMVEAIEQLAHGVLDAVDEKPPRRVFYGADTVDHPPHYTAHPSGIEVIRITEHMNFCLGNVIKYVLRAPHKGNQIEDLRKAQWYLQREIERLESRQ
jgi:hypothetical protein